jgi:dienelactone hydrolase
MELTTGVMVSADRIPVTSFWLSLEPGIAPELKECLRMVQLARRFALCISTLCIAGIPAVAQDLTPVGSALQTPVQSPEVTYFQLQNYLMKRISVPHAPSRAEEWVTAAKKLRKHILEDVVYHGWPQSWVEAPPHFEQVEVIETGKGYRLRKFRYEIVPGFWSAAVLYEPEGTQGKMPAILNVIGHEPHGNAVEYEQKRCINFAKRGMLALSLSWIGFGQMAQPGNEHDYAAALDLVGSSGVGFFYLSMRRGLDFLASLPQADPARLGVTGLSGGGWQTVLLSGLDERVAVSVEVAGIGSQQSNLTRPEDTDEVEESPTDFTVDEDYPFLVALRVPRPTLLIHNAEDDCCFRADLVKPYIYEQIRPFFKLFGEESALAWHENRDPGTHNYQLDNRQQAYAFFTRNFHLPLTPTEIVSDAEIRTPQELAVGLPADNLTVAALARRLGGQVERPPIRSDKDARASWVQQQRTQLKSVIRLKPVSLENAWRMANTKHLGLHTLSYRFDFDNGLSATGIWLAAIASQPDAPVTIVLNDKGYKASESMVSERVSRGEQVLALDTILNGATMPKQSNGAVWPMMLATDGDRALGLEVAQLLATSRWLQKTTGQYTIRLETEGIRSQMVGLIAAALEPDLFSNLVSNEVLVSLGDLLAGPLVFRTTPDVFCLDLYKYFDIDRLQALAVPTKIENGQKANLVALTPKAP